MPGELISVLQQPRVGEENDGGVDKGAGELQVREPTGLDFAYAALALAVGGSVYFRRSLQYAEAHQIDQKGLPGAVQQPLDEDLPVE